MLSKKNLLIGWLAFIATIQLATVQAIEIPQSEQVSLIVSGGNQRPFTKSIVSNHQDYAKRRGIRYKFYDLDDDNSYTGTTANYLLTNLKLQYYAQQLSHVIDDYSSYLAVNIELLLINDQLQGKQKYWAKIAILQQAIKDPKVPDDSWIAWIDDDIAINDINLQAPMLDRIIEQHGHGKHLIVAEETDPRVRVNTGIILLRKSGVSNAILKVLWQRSDDLRLGYDNQSQCFHEQEALKEIITGDITYAMGDGKFMVGKIVYQDQNGISLKEYIATLPPRMDDLNFNTLRRKSHRDPLRKMSLRYDDPYHVKAQDSDAFIHHTGMRVKLRTDMIMKTLADIDAANHQFDQNYGQSLKSEEIEDVFIYPAPTQSFKLKDRVPDDLDLWEHRHNSHKHKEATRIRVAQ